MKLLKRIIPIFLILLLILAAIFALGRYGWKLLGFQVCEEAGIESVEVGSSTVKIKGFSPGSFPEGFCGYYAEEQDGRLYVGFAFSAVFGFSETGDFDVAIPVEGEIPGGHSENEANGNQHLDRGSRRGSSSGTLRCVPVSGQKIRGLFIMSKRTRQYLGILAAVVGYYLIHEGAHFLYALLTGVFKQIKFMGLGVQIDVYAERMTDTQLGLFCLAGALATFLAAYLLAALAKRICRMKSKLLRAMLYYITIALLLIDPLYLSALCGLFGGGDMNGIALLCPEWAVRCLSGALLIANALVFWRRIFPVYRQSFSERRTA